MNSILFSFTLGTYTGLSFPTYREQCQRDRPFIPYLSGIKGTRTAFHSLLIGTCGVLPRLSFPTYRDFI